jgi:hypothetical protein
MINIGNTDTGDADQLRGLKGPLGDSWLKVGGHCRSDLDLTHFSPKRRETILGLLLVLYRRGEPVAFEYSIRSCRDPGWMALLKISISS